jgi:hypothetical protein
MGKLKPEKFSQRLQDLNTYLDYIPIERTAMADKTQKAYGELFTDDTIRSFMRRSIPPECTVKLLALGKEPWRLKYLDDQLNMYPQQWQADEQKQRIPKMTGKMPDKSNDGKRKNNERHSHNNNGGRSGGHQGNIDRGGRGGRGSNNSYHLKKMYVSIVAKIVIIRLTSPHHERMKMKIQTWYPKRISKIYFNLL